MAWIAKSTAEKNPALLPSAKGGANRLEREKETSSPMSSSKGEWFGGPVIFYKRPALGKKRKNSIVAAIGSKRLVKSNKKGQKRKRQQSIGGGKITYLRQGDYHSLVKKKAETNERRQKMEETLGQNNRAST